MTTSIVLHVACEVPTAVTPSPRVCEVAAMFGLGVDERRTLTIVPPTELTLGAGQIIFITGASGGGKTTLLRLIREQLAGRADAHIIDFDALGNDTSGGGALIEAIGGTLEVATRRLALAGLNDAFVMLRRVGELSDGQRYRFQLAQAIAEAENTPQAASLNSERGALAVLLADEFTATLDRLTAKVIARNLRKWVSRANVCFIAATTHDDLLEHLEPDVLIVQHPGEAMQVVKRS